MVHPSNGFLMLDGVSHLRINDVVKTEAKIASVTNTNSGKAVNVIGTIIQDEEPVIEVTSFFLYYGRFTDYKTSP